MNGYIFANDVEIYKFKAKDSEINAVVLCLGNVSKKLSVNNIKNTGLYGYVYDFQLIMLVLILMIFQIFINIEWSRIYINWTIIYCVIEL